MLPKRNLKKDIKAVKNVAKKVLKAPSKILDSYESRMKRTREARESKIQEQMNKNYRGWTPKKK